MSGIADAHPDNHDPALVKDPHQVALPDIPWREVEGCIRKAGLPPFAAQSLVFAALGLVERRIPVYL